DCGFECRPDPESCAPWQRRQESARTKGSPQAAALQGFVAWARLPSEENWYCHRTTVAKNLQRRRADCNRIVKKSLPLVPKGRWHEVPEGIRTDDNPSGMALAPCQLPFTGEPLRAAGCRPYAQRTMKFTAVSPWRSVPNS